MRFSTWQQTTLITRDPSLLKDLQSITELANPDDVSRPIPECTHLDQFVAFRERMSNNGADSLRAFVQAKPRQETTTLNFSALIVAEESTSGDLAGNVEQLAPASSRRETHGSGYGSISGVSAGDDGGGWCEGTGGCE